MEFNDKPGAVVSDRDNKIIKYLIRISYILYKIG